MKIFTKVRGTSKIVSNIEVNKDTVYVRSNIAKVDEEDFKGWEYDEIQYSIRGYMEVLANTQDTQSIAMLVALLMSENDNIKKRLDIMEVK